MAVASAAVNAAVKPARLLGIDLDDTMLSDSSAVVIAKIVKLFGITSKGKQLLRDLVKSFDSVAALNKVVAQEIEFRPYVIESIRLAIDRGYEVVITTHNRGCDADLVDTPDETKSGEAFVLALLEAQGLEEEYLSKIKVVAGYTGCPELAKDGKNGHLTKAMQLTNVTDSKDVMLFDDAMDNITAAMAAGFLAAAVPVAKFDNGFWQRVYSLIENNELFDDRRRQEVLWPGACVDSEVSGIGQYLSALNTNSCLGWQLVTADPQMVGYACVVDDARAAYGVDELYQLHKAAGVVFKDAPVVAICCYRNPDEYFLSFSIDQQSPLAAVLRDFIPTLTRHGLELSKSESVTGSRDYTITGFANNEKMASKWQRIIQKGLHQLCCSVDIQQQDIAGKNVLTVLYNSNSIQKADELLREYLPAMEALLSAATEQKMAKAELENQPPLQKVASAMARHGVLPAPSKTPVVPAASGGLKRASGSTNLAALALE